MSAGFDSAVIRALLKLWLSYSSSSANRAVCSGALSCCFGFSFFVVLCFMLLCMKQQRLNLGFRTVSMRLRPKRTSSGVECFGGFHIKRFNYLFIFLRGDLPRYHRDNLDSLLFCSIFF